MLSMVLLKEENTEGEIFTNTTNCYKDELLMLLWGAVAIWAGVRRGKRSPTC